MRYVRAWKLVCVRVDIGVLYYLNGSEQQLCIQNYACRNRIFVLSSVVLRVFLRWYTKLPRHHTHTHTHLTPQPVHNLFNQAYTNPNDPTPCQFSARLVAFAYIFCKLCGRCCHQSAGTTRIDHAGSNQKTNKKFPPPQHDPFRTMQNGLRLCELRLSVTYSIFCILVYSSCPRVPPPKFGQTFSDDFGAVFFHR